MNNARISKVLCMVSAVYIALVQETIFSAIFWLLYVAGAIFGIIHFKKVHDKDTMEMYVVWLVLDVFAFCRLVWNFTVAITVVLSICLSFTAFYVASKAVGVSRKKKMHVFGVNEACEHYYDRRERHWCNHDERMGYIEKPFHKGCAKCTWFEERVEDGKEKQ